MDLEELQAALDRHDDEWAPPFWVKPIVEAARLVANPNIKAVAVLICELVFGEDWDGEIPLVQFNEAKRYVAAALTPQGDTK